MVILAPSATSSLNAVNLMGSCVGIQGVSPQDVQLDVCSFPSVDTLTWGPYWDARWASSFDLYCIQKIIHIIQSVYAIFPAEYLFM